MALVGTPQHYGRTMLVIGVDAPGAGQPVISLDDIQRYDEILFHCTVGSCTALVSLDGVNYLAAPLAWENEMSTSPNTRETALDAGDVYLHVGNIKGIQILQTGATGVVNARLLCAQSGH